MKLQISILRKRQLSGVIRCASLIIRFCLFPLHLELPTCVFFQWSHLSPYCSNIIWFSLSPCVLTLHIWHHFFFFCQPKILKQLLIPTIIYVNFSVTTMEKVSLGI